MEKLQTYSITKLPPTPEEAKAAQQPWSQYRVYQGLDGNFYFFAPAVQQPVNNEMMQQTVIAAKAQ